MSTTTNNSNTQAAPLTEEQAALVESHRSLAASIARGFIGRGIDADDLVSIAHLALVRAARNFDTAGEAPFAAYGASWVRHCIIHELHAMVCTKRAAPGPRAPRVAHGFCRYSTRASQRK